MAHVNSNVLVMNTRIQLKDFANVKFVIRAAINVQGLEIKIVMENAIVVNFIMI